MLKKALLAVVTLIVILVIVVAMQPNSFRIERSITISAPPSAVFAQINDFHRWQAWSPWEKLDPAMQKTYSGPPAGIGSAYAWQGNDKVGSGQMTILESNPDTLVQIRLAFLKPFAATNMAEFVLAAQGNATHVTWSMTGHNNFMFKAAGLFMNVDKMVGKDFENGLAHLKTVSEASAQANNPKSSPGAR